MTDSPERRYAVRATKKGAGATKGASVEPRIQYARTSDGVSIAFWTLGEGMPLVLIQPPPFSHIQLEWEWPLARRTYEKLARRRQLIRYDGRGSGLSERGHLDFSLQASVLDLSAVIERLRLERLALVAYGDAGPAAVAYAARHPKEVTHLVLYATYARGGWEEEPEVQGLYKLVDSDWRLFTETLAHALFGWSAEHGSWWAQFCSQSTTQDAVKAAWEASFEYDVTDLLPAVRARTLVMHPALLRWATMDQAKLLASRIPNAQLAVLEGVSGVLIYEESGPIVTAIDEFLSEGEEAAPAAAQLPSDLPSGTAVILFADIADSTALTERLGDAAFRVKARELDGALRGIIRENGGTPVEGKLLGDGVLAVFTSARQAIEAALRCGGAGDDVGLPLHLGIHAGDVIREGDNVFGGAVNIAARIAAASAPGEVLVSETVRGLARTSAGVSFEDRGERTLKGIGEPQRLYEVRRRES